MTAAEYLCGRPTKSGQPCKASKVGPPFYLRLRAAFGSPLPGLPSLPHSCKRHLTADERAVMDSLQAAEDAEIAAMGPCAEAKDPACWSWPVTAELDARADLVADCTDQGEAWELAMRVLRDFQDGRCAICGGDAEVVDHDHATGFVRGWCCKGCNTREGFAVDPDSPCVRYRNLNPAMMLRLQIRYHSPFTGWAEPEPVIDEAERLATHPAHILSTRYGVRRDG